MPPISRSRFAALLRRLSSEDFVAFVADLWDARGWTTEVRDDVVVATRDAPTADRHVLLVKHTAPVFDGAELSSNRSDVTHVVTSDEGTAPAEEFAATLEADLVGRARLYDMAVFALDTTAREAVFRRHFDRSPMEAERSGVVASIAAGLRTRRGVAAALVGVLLVVAVVAGAATLLDDSPIDDGGAGDEGPGVETSTPEPFTVPDSVPAVTTSPATPQPTDDPTATATPNRTSFDVVGATGNDTWRTFRGDPARTGHRPDVDGPRGDVAVAARFSTDFGFVSSPAVVDDTVYVGGVDGMLYSLRAGSLSVHWERYLNGAILSSPTVANDTVYVGSMSVISPGVPSTGDATDRLHAVDASRGEVAWNGSTEPISLSSPGVVNGTVYVGSTDGRVYALDVRNGSTRWSAATNGSVEGSPAVADGLVYAGSSDGRVYAFDAANGSTRWSVATNDSVIATPAVASETVFVGSADGRVYAFDAANGSTRWSVATNDSVYASSAVADGTVYVGSTDGRIYALDAESGRQEWTYRTDRSVSSSPTVADGTVYVGDMDRRLYALDPASGDERWSVDVDSGVQSSPAVANGVVYVGTDNGELLAIAERPRSD